MTGGRINMLQIKQGYIIAIRKEKRYYYYLILSAPVFFGCQWSYAFHRKSKQLLELPEILSGYGSGFHALIDFNKESDKKNISIISKKIDVESYQIKKNSKVRIDKPDGGYEWYIFNPEFQILRKQKSLNAAEINLPVASGITCNDAAKLINMGWKTDQIVEEEGQGQYPI